MKRRADDLPIVLVPHPHVRVEQSVMGGSPHVAGTRVPVRPAPSRAALLRAIDESGAAGVLADIEKRTLSGAGSTG